MNPIYDQFFPANGPAPEDWQPFNQYEALRGDVLSPDFIVGKRTWEDVAKTIALVLLKIVVFPWGLYELAKALVGRIAMLIAYPAQYIFSREEMNELRMKVQRALSSGLLVGREVVLEKEGRKYCGLVVGGRENIGNGKWALFAPGNCATIEGQFVNGCLNPYFDAGYNVLLVNGPGVGGSEGLATVDRIGDAQDVALLFLEEAVKAKRIVLAGHSLGGAAIGLAAMKHEFKPDVHYLAMRMMTFDRLSHLVKELHSTVASKVISWICDMDSVAASKRLQEKGIHEVVIQAEEDEIMSQASLLDGLVNENMMENKTGIVIPGADHCTLPGDEMVAQIQRWDRSLDPAAAV